ncbi:MAG: tryptophan synthase subunit alpha [Bacteroidota bacterium]
MTISKYIEDKNTAGEKVLSVFLTGGYPEVTSFPELALSVLDAGADMLEIGFPFSDPLAEGPVIQRSSYEALRNGVSIKTVLDYTCSIKRRSDKPVILMGYANPLMKYGVKNFYRDAISSGVSGLILPDIPLDEYDSFYGDVPDALEIILLTTPSSTVDKIHSIDKRSRGFVYCVSVNGTTGERSMFDEEVLSSLHKTYSLISKNKMLVGFGISGADSVRQVKSCCDGVIVGSAVIKRLMNNGTDYQAALSFVNELKNSLL